MNNVQLEDSKVYFDDNLEPHYYVWICPKCGKLNFEGETYQESDLSYKCVSCNTPVETYLTVGQVTLRKDDTNGM